MPLPAAIPSPPQGVWEIGPIPIRAYALCIIIGIIVAGYWGNKRLVARGGRPGAITDLAIWMVPFGLIGGRIYHLITDPELYFYGRPGTSPWNAFAIWNGGLGIWGAVALGGLGGYIAARRYKIAFGAVADAVAPCIVLAQGIGRIGNYFNQELFGSPTSLPWGLEVFLRTPGGIPGTAAQCGSGEFPTEWIKSSSDILCGTYHPTFLYELIWDVLIAILVVVADRYFRLGHGRAFALYVAGYTAGRGWIEMLRIDHANHILGLRLNVFVAAVVFLAAVIYLIATRRLGREDPAAVFGVSPESLRRGATAGSGHGSDAVDGDGSGSVDGDVDDDVDDDGSGDGGPVGDAAHADGDAADREADADGMSDDETRADSRDADGTDGAAGDGDSASDERAAGNSGAAGESDGTRAGDPATAPESGTDPVSMAEPRDGASS